MKMKSKLKQSEIEDDAALVQMTSTCHLTHAQNILSQLFMSHISYKQNCV